MLLHREYPTSDPWLKFGDGFWRRNRTALHTCIHAHKSLSPGMDEDNNGSSQDMKMR